MFKILKYALNKRTITLLVINILLVLVAAASDVGVPVILSKLQATLQPNAELAFPQYSALANGGIWTAIMALVAFVSLAAGYLSVIFLSRMLAIITYNLRNRMYAKVQTFSLVDLDHIKSSSLLTRMTQDVVMLKNSYMFMFRTLIKSVCIYIGSAIAIITMCSQSSSDAGVAAQGYPNIPSWSIIVLIFVCTLVLILVIMGSAAPAIKYFSRSQKGVDKINRLVQEDVIGQRVVKSFNLQEEQIATFNIASEALRSSSTSGSKRMFIAFPTIYFVLNIIMPIVTWISPAGLMSKFASLSILLGLIVSSIIMIIVSMVQIGRSIPSVRRIKELFDYEPKIKYPTEGVELPNDALNTIEINNLSFKFNPENDYNLKNINISIKPNEVVGIIGSTSAGKTTLLNLILRMYDVVEGEIKLCGVNIKDYTKDQLKALITYCPQIVTLFEGTIKSNLLFAKPDTTNEELIDACQIANAYDFIMQKEGDFDHEVVERGNNFSGGQKQRLAIARTLLKKSRFLILDDSTSALDMLTEKEIQNELLKNKYNQTMLLVAQRISAVKNANRIIVMDKGEVIGFDTHINLLKNCQAYYDIAISQLGEREVENEIRQHAND